MTKAYLGEVARILPGFAFKSELFNGHGELPLIRIRDVVKGYSETRYSGPYSATYIVKNGDLLVSMDGDFRANVWRGGKALLNQRVCKIEPNNFILDKTYLAYWLPKELRRIEDATPFVTVKHLSAETLRALPIQLPTLEEQKRIAAILDKADAIRRKREQAIQLADEFLRSLFLDMFGDPVRNPKGWPVTPLADMFSKTKSGTRCGPFGSSLRKEEYQKSGMAVWGIENVLPNRFRLETTQFITESKYEQLSTFAVSVGDILVSRAGTVGRMCVVDQPVGPSIIGTNLIRLSLDAEVLRPEFFVAMFTFFPNRFTQLRANAKADAYSFLSTAALSSFSLPVPDIDLQQKFVAALRRLRQIQTSFEDFESLACLTTNSLTKTLFSLGFDTQQSS